MCADLASEAGVDAVVDAAMRQFGAIDIWIANAGTGQACDPFTDDTTFNHMWNLHAMSQVWAARALLPGWLDRRSGHFVAVVSSNALTTNPVSMAYAIAQKHAQLAAVEWLAMTYGAQEVANRLLPEGHADTTARAARKDQRIRPSRIGRSHLAEQAASMLIEAVGKNLTIVHTHPAVLADARLRIDDHKAYLRSLEELHALATEIGAPR